MYDFVINVWNCYERCHFYSEADVAHNIAHTFLHEPYKGSNMNMVKNKLLVRFFFASLLALTTLQAQERKFASSAKEDSEIGNYRKQGIDVVQQRVFRVRNRHEFSMDLGGIVDNQFLNYGIGRVGYTYHLRETLGFQLTGGYALHQNKALVADLSGPTVECPDDVIDSNTGQPPTGCPLNILLDPMKSFGMFNVVFSPFYGKFALFSKKILHFNIFINAGPGYVFNENSKRFSFNVGLGGKIFINEWASVRIGIENLTVRQGQPFNQITNNRIYSLGMSFFLPTKARK